MRIIYLLAILVFLGSCVSNRKSTLMQRKDLHAGNLPKDTVVRSYVQDTFAYRIQPNDILSVKFESLTAKEFDIFSAQSNTNSVANAMQGNALLIGELVNEKGEIEFSGIGNVKVAGLTVFEAEDLIEKLAKPFTESPIVKVRLINYRITIMGEVAREGTITLGNNKVSMLEAIALAGGLGDLADRHNIKLMRQKGDKTDIVYINLLDEDFINSPYYYVHQGDVLIVPPLKQRPFRRYAGQNLALFVSVVSVLLLSINLLQN